MGSAKSKEEIVINQASNGDAKSQTSNSGFSLSESLLIALVVAVALFLIYIIVLRYRKTLRKTIRREINKEMLRRSRDELTVEQEV